MDKLTRDQYDELQTQYERTPGIGEAMITGEHYILMAILNRFGYRPQGREAALELAERLLSNGY